MWLRNVVCSVVTLAGALAFGHYWRELGKGLGADHDLSGTAIFLTLSIAGALCIYLIARAADVRAGRLPALREKLRRPPSRPARRAPPGPR